MKMLNIFTFLMLLKIPGILFSFAISEDIILTVEIFHVILVIINYVNILKFSLQVSLFLCFNSDNPPKNVL